MLIFWIPPHIPACCVWAVSWRTRGPASQSIPRGDGHPATLQQSLSNPSLGWVPSSPKSGQLAKWRKGPRSLRLTVSSARRSEGEGLNMRKEKIGASLESQRPKARKHQEREVMAGRHPKSTYLGLAPGPVCVGCRNPCGDTCQELQLSCAKASRCPGTRHRGFRKPKGPLGEKTTPGM